MLRAGNAETVMRVGVKGNQYGDACECDGERACRTDDQTDYQGTATGTTETTVNS